ncbi:MAG: futalosine hydrolase [Bacteroidetes bacterium HGW-Bacteroidetes-22]|nr:MAG: futalosine hydrolase [Bacteroidetes bacterium HGW-Bacteroidetes-22]
MQILLIFATPIEAGIVQPLLGKEFKSGDRFQIGCHQVDLLISGVGMVPASIITAMTLAVLRPDLVLHAGISGSYHQSVSIGQTVWVDSECFPELGKESDEDFVTFDKMGFDFAGLPFNNNTLRNPFEGYRYLPYRPVMGGATVSCISNQPDRGTSVHRRFGALTESMEGGAVLAACMLAKIDCLQLRTISNYCLPPPDDEWNLKLALDNLQRAVVDTLKSL